MFITFEGNGHSYALLLSMLTDSAFLEGNFVMHTYSLFKGHPIGHGYSASKKCFPRKHQRHM